MDQQGYVFQRVTSLTAAAVGQPGHRTFYLAVGEGESWVRVWLEKGELASLSTAFGEILETVVKAGHHPPLAEADTTPQILSLPQGDPLADFKLGRLVVGYDQSHDRIGLFVYKPEATGDSPALVCWITRPQALTLGNQIDAVCSSGRPICVFCGGPIDPEGHACPRSNGHRQIEL